MSNPLRIFVENLARRTSRRRLLGRGAQTAFGVLAGAAAGTIVRPGIVGARIPGVTCCSPPGHICFCEHCQSSGICLKPCTYNTTWYASGCWTCISNEYPDTPGFLAMCCDCTCPSPDGICGCASDQYAHVCV